MNAGSDEVVASVPDAWPAIFCCCVPTHNAVRTRIAALVATVNVKVARAAADAGAICLPAASGVVALAGVHRPIDAGLRSKLSHRLTPTLQPIPRRRHRRRRWQ